MPQQFNSRLHKRTHRSGDSKAANLSASFRHHPRLPRGERDRLAGSQSNLVSLAKAGAAEEGQGRGGGGKTRACQGNVRTIRSVRRARLLLLQTSRRCWRPLASPVTTCFPKLLHSCGNCKKNDLPQTTFMSVYLGFEANKGPCRDDLCPGSYPSSHFSCDSLRPPLRCRLDLLRSSPVHPDDSSSTVYISQDTEATRTPSGEEWRKKTWCVYTMEYYSVIERVQFCHPNQHRLTWRVLSLAA